MKIRIALSLIFLFYHLNAIDFPAGNSLPIHEAFAPKFTDLFPPVPATKNPPALLNENIPTQPSTDLIWIPGYWMWIEEKNDFAWICGVWRRPPPKQKWIPSQWTAGDGGWVRTRGFWSAVPPEKLPFFRKMPPRMIEDKVPPAPSDNYFWIPGQWIYSYDEEKYVWLSGKWEPFHDSWVYSPSTYIWTPKGFLFVPSYWDWGLLERGFAYTCNSIVDPKLIETKMIVHHLYCYYPDYITFFWHCWHFHPEWWDGCDCIPTWWFWRDWWTFSWNNMWGCWWWWTHPGSIPPAWITYDISMRIAPPSTAVLELFSRLARPPFEIKPGSQALAPLAMTGGFVKMNMPKPAIPMAITPAGTIKSPPLPGNQAAQIILEGDKRSSIAANSAKNPSLEEHRRNEISAHWPPDSTQRAIADSSSTDSYYPGDPGFKNSRYTDHPVTNGLPSSSHSANKVVWPNYPQNSYPAMPKSQGSSNLVNPGGRNIWPDTPLNHSRIKQEYPQGAENPLSPGDRAIWLGSTSNYPAAHQNQYLENNNPAAKQDREIWPNY